MDCFSPILSSFGPSLLYFPIDFAICGYYFVILLSIAGVYILTNKVFSKSIKKHLLLFLIVGILLTSWTTIIFKASLAPPNQDILTNLSMENIRIVDFGRLSIIGGYLLSEFLDSRWCSVWFLIAFMAVRGLFLRTIESLFFIPFIIHWLVDTGSIQTHNPSLSI